MQRVNTLVDMSYYGGDGTKILTGLRTPGLITRTTVFPKYINEILINIITKSIKQ
jgi:hypothetical protein